MKKEGKRRNRSEPSSEPRSVREGGERRENKGEGRKNGEDRRLRTKRG